MSKTLMEIAQQLQDANKKVQLIYAFNGSGKTRLSREFIRELLERVRSIQANERRNTFTMESFAEYDKFNKQQHIESDFDREVKKLLQKKDHEK
jgi:tRNA uridine 5-carbamoylmethylation protein Kti12